ncbi:MAG TPA: hypothetical protein DHN33_06140 [Eubacteriaceae bacterium]|nr:hypothetical protein [Eubacteriaceae bacterium]
MESINQKCASYLKERDGTERIMKGLWKKYRSFGGLKGNYQLMNPTEEERLFLRGLFKKDFSQQKSISISLEKFERAFDGTLYEGIALKEVLEAFYQTPLIWKKETQEKKNQQRNECVQKIVLSLNDENVAKWFQKSYHFRNRGIYTLFLRLYEQSCEKLQETIKNIEAIQQLCETSPIEQSLPVLAAQVTKDPHALDRGRVLRKVLLYYICEREGAEYPKTALEENDLFARFQIATDSSITSVLTFGLSAFDREKKSLGWMAFYSRKEPLALSGLNLKNAQNLESISSRVICFENPASFYSHLLSEPDIAAVCTGGQVNVLTYRLLDMLYQAEKSFVYQGDFDPEGLLIADKLKCRYPTMDVSFFSKDNYERCLSDNVINEKRLKQLDGLQRTELIDLAQYIKQYKKAGYQEYLIKPFDE